ncbi:PDZ domain-containing protein [Hydrogenimonas cancrithermarum]|uniref:PDZ domain-containing protein n=1 Tax=Hydrogenimonas cancrithermarum TaxID=2993563 RepID=A0ABN6WVU8_9BACT|nr:PDZ domain-containing protein [Hydrogenimonas cancrithermarum]
MIGGHPAYAVAKNRFLSLVCPPNKKVIANDPFKGLCLFEDTAAKPFYLTAAKPPLFYCPANRPEPVEIVSYPVSIYPGKLKKEYENEGALFGGCCRLAGLVASGGIWFDTAAIRKLIKGDTRHGDIGVRFTAEKEKVTVTAVDPFSKLPLMPGDRLMAIEKLNHPTLRQLRERIDRCQAGETLFLLVGRNGKSFGLHAACFDRVGGGKLSDTFLEHYGIWFDDRLAVREIAHDGIAYKKGIRRGDRLVMIEGKKVKNQAEVRVLLSHYGVKKSVPENMLWERENFQFFLALPAL